MAARAPGSQHAQQGLYSDGGAVVTQPPTSPTPRPPRSLKAFADPPLPPNTRAARGERAPIVVPEAFRAVPAHLRGEQVTNELGAGIRDRKHELRIRTKLEMEAGRKAAERHKTQRAGGPTKANSAAHDAEPAGVGMALNASLGNGWQEQREKLSQSARWYLENVLPFPQPGEEGCIVVALQRMDGKWMHLPARTIDEAQGVVLDAAANANVRGIFVAQARMRIARIELERHLHVVSFEREHSTLAGELHGRGVEWRLSSICTR